MRYVIRNERGEVTSAHLDPVPGSEALPLGHPDVQAFLRPTDAQQAFAGLDADLVRVLEDLIDVLIERNVLRVTDLPTSAQVKLFDRKHFRQAVRNHSLALYSEGQELLGSVESPASDGVLSVDVLDIGVTGSVDAPR